MRLANCSAAVALTHGGLGFTTNLDTHGTTVLFGPATFQPEQTSGDDGTVQIPVQGRAQPHDISDATETVDKQFSLWFDAGLDPLEASQLGRAAADDALCFGTALGGGGFATFAECQNAIIDIVKQLHWHVGEYFFPLTDWQQSGWEANAFISPYAISTVKCDGAGGTWSLDLQGNLSGAQYNATVEAEVDGLSGKGIYSLSGQAVGGASPCRSQERASSVSCWTARAWHIWKSPARSSAQEMPGAASTDTS